MISTDFFLPDVIVRAFDDEPVHLFAHRLNLQANTVLVGSRSASKPIGMAFDEVYDFDAEMFEKLTAAYREGKTTDLSALYDDCRRKTNSCNKYKISLESSHEQKAEIPNTRSAT